MQFQFSAAQNELTARIAAGAMIFAQAQKSLSA